MATKTPAERALTDVEKAIKDADKTHEKYETLQGKADEALEAANRSLKTLKWTASHPDLPDNFDLDEFRRSLEAPFDDALEAEAEAIGDAIESGAIDPDALEEPVTEVDENAVTSAPRIDATDEAAPEDDPWGDEA